MSTDNPEASRSAAPFAVVQPRAARATPSSGLHRQPREQRRYGERRHTASGLEATGDESSTHLGRQTRVKDCFYRSEFLRAVVQFSRNRECRGNDGFLLFPHACIASASTAPQRDRQGEGVGGGGVDLDSSWKEFERGHLSGAVHNLSRVAASTLILDLEAICQAANAAGRRGNISLLLQFGWGDESCARGWC